MVAHIKIPPELLEQLERKNVLFCIGHGINQNLLPSMGELAYELAERCDYPSDEPKTLARVAGYYELTTRNRHRLIELLRERLDKPDLEPSLCHKLIAQLQPRVIVTTCYDRLLERAMKDANINYAPVVSNTEVAYGDEEKMLLVWLWGILDRPNSIIVTEDDRRQFIADRKNLSDILRGELARRTLLFIGFDVEDAWFRDFYDSVTHSLDRHNRPAYIVGTTPGAYTRAWWDNHNAQVLGVEIEQFLSALINQPAIRAKVTDIDQSHPIGRLVTPLPKRPYKLLDYYEAEDEAIFFGRETEERKLASLVYAHRLVLLYGASGAGKTSLLLAGVKPQLKQADPPYEIVYVRALEDPSRIIHRTIQRRRPEIDLPKGGSLVDFLNVATKALGSTLVIILDQFEEFFIRLTPQTRAAFVAELGKLYDARDVPVKLILSLREDWLASVNEIRERIPEVFYIGMRLLPLSRDQARQAIVAPVTQLEVNYEPELVERLLGDLMDSEDEAVMPPQLQLVCCTLYDQVWPEKHLITLDTYKELGGTRGVLQRYLDDKLIQLESRERALARSILEELVTSQGTKAVKKADDLALALNADIPDITQALEKLSRARLVRMLEHEDNISYELAHEYLICQINLSPEEQQKKQAEELIQQELENWNRLGTLLGANKFDMVNQVRNLIRLTPDAQELLLRSALAIGHETSFYWLERVADETQRANIVRDYLADSWMEVRLWTARTLYVWEASIVGELLATTAINDSDASVRQQAAISLARWRDPAVAVSKLMGIQDVSIDRVYEALAHILDEVGGLPGLSHKIRMQVMKVLLLRRLRQAKVTLLYRALAGGFGAAIGAALAAALVTYILWQPNNELFFNLPLSVAMGLIGLQAGVVGLIEGIGTSLGLTLADILAKKPSVYFRVVGAMTSGGIFLSVAFVLLRLMGVWDPTEVSYSSAFVSGFMGGAIISGTIALTIPGFGIRYSLIKHAALGAIAAGGIIFVISTLSNMPLEGVLMYSVTIGTFGMGMVLGLGLLDRLIHRS